MNDDHHAEPSAEAEEVEALLPNRVIGVRQQDSIFVGKCRLGLLERYPVFPEILFGLGRCPLEAEVVRTAK